MIIKFNKAHKMCADVPLSPHSFIQIYIRVCSK